MKKIIIATLVGGILLFCWQGLSWMVMGIHEKAYKYTPAQDTLLKALSSSLTEEGQYSLPNVPPGTARDKMQEIGKTWEGKPWAMVTYHKAYNMDMAKPIIRGLLICMVCVWLCCIVIGRMGTKSFASVFSTALIFGIISFLFVWYNGHNWMHTPWGVIQGELIDDLAAWGLVGIWLGWLYGRK